MANADDLRALALALDGTVEQPHFDRAAFKARRIYVTVAADRLTANFRFTPEEQEFRCGVQAHAFRKVTNKFGDAGWTTATLAELDRDELAGALKSAWENNRGPAERGRKRSR